MPIDILEVVFMLFRSLFVFSVCTYEAIVLGMACKEEELMEKFPDFTMSAGRPGSSEVPRNPLTRWDVSSTRANGIFLT